MLRCFNLNSSTSYAFFRALLQAMHRALQESCELRDDCRSWRAALKPRRRRLLGPLHAQLRQQRVLHSMQRLSGVFLCHLR
jgi:hypothetical protein